MTIKEVEDRTGLARANIRYYEDQGFFSAARGENGYRNYSGENVETLLKVKLFRQLGFSLEDIRDLQRGDQRLETALLRREEGLDREQLALDRAARLCRELPWKGPTSPPWTPGATWTGWSRKIPRQLSRRTGSPEGLFIFAGTVPVCWTG